MKPKQYMLTRWDKSKSTDRTAQKGSSIVEIIVAMGIFVVVSANIVVLYLGAYGSSLRDVERLEAQMLLQEGLTAVRSIADYSHALLTNGTHGLTDTNGYFELAGTQNQIGQYLRTIQITGVNRAGASLINNSDCSITPSGGIADSRTKLVTVTVAWDLEEGNSTSLQGTEYITDFRSQEGCGESSWLHADVTDAYITNGNLTVGGIDFLNNGAGTVTIASITPSWTAGTQLETFSISGNVLWQSAEDPYVPTLSSGTPITVNLSATSAATLTIDDMTFNGSMLDETITFIVTMNDGTQRYLDLSDTPGTPPPPPPPPPPPGGDQADSLIIDISGARLISNNKKLIGIILSNESGEDIEINKMTLTWTGGTNGTDILTIWINGDVIIWDQNKPSGFELDVTDYILELGEQYPLDMLFKKSMLNSFITLTIEMEDGSIAVSEVIDL